VPDYLDEAIKETNRLLRQTFGREPMAICEKCGKPMKSFAEGGVHLCMPKEKAIPYAGGVLPSPAFPSVIGEPVPPPVVTLWDRYAMAALTGGMAIWCANDCSWEHMAKLAGRAADAMLTEKKRRGE